MIHVFPHIPNNLSYILYKIVFVSTLKMVDVKRSQINFNKLLNNLIN